MHELALGRHIVRVDDVDTDLLSLAGWYVTDRGHVQRVVPAPSGGRCETLHRLVAHRKWGGLPSRAQVRPRNGDGCDCRRGNLAAGTAGTFNRVLGR